MVKMAKMAKMGGGAGCTKAKRGKEFVTTLLVLFRAWLQRNGSSLGEVVGRVEVEVGSWRGRCRRSERVTVKTALTGQPRQAMCGLGAGPRGFFSNKKTAQYRNIQ